VAAGTAIASAWGGLLVGLVFGIVVGLAVGGLLAWWAVAAIRGRPRRRGALGVLRIVGPIGGGGPLVPGVSAEPVLRALVQARRARWVRAVVLRIDSPGGAVGTTQEIAAEIARLRAAGKPVIASVGDICASGGFWLACACDRIVAPPGALLGSIGVIIAKPVLRDLMERIGAERQKVLSGPHKDLMALERPWDEAELGMLTAMNEAIFGQFIDAVAAGRGLPPAAVRAVADGRVFAASQALALGLCDRLGNFEDASALAREMAGVPERAPAVDLSQGHRSLAGWLLGRLSPVGI
jgi:protease-4